MAIGIVKKVVQDRGFGFITAEDGKDYFFHRTEIAGSLAFESLAGGERVQFEIVQDAKGPRASKVEPA